nr:MAG TPA: hypothetical protein [Caudoviricetes sp.]
MLPLLATNAADDTVCDFKLYSDKSIDGVYSPNFSQELFI